MSKKEDHERLLPGSFRRSFAKNRYHRPRATKKDDDGGGASPPSSSSSNKDANQNHRHNMSLCAFLWAYGGLWCSSYPCCGSCITTAVAFVALLIMLNWFFNPVLVFGTSGRHGHQHMNPKIAVVETLSDLQAIDVDHWCLGVRHSNWEDCPQCPDPLVAWVPPHQLADKPWTVAHRLNQQLAQTTVDGGSMDVAFIGTSVVEPLDGRWYGTAKRHPNKNRARLAFQQFQARTGSNAVALGIAGDTSPNLLWRLQNGESENDEYGESTSPKLFWLETGSNDLAKTRCSEEVVVLGIIRVVEELLERSQRQQSHVVINLLFPIVDFRNEEVDGYPQFSDFFGDANNGDGGQAQQQQGGQGGGNDGNNDNPSANDNQKGGLSSLSALRGVLGDDYDDFGVLGDLSDDDENGGTSRARDVVLDPRRRKVRKYRPLKWLLSGGQGSAARERWPLWTSIRAINMEVRTASSCNCSYIALELFVSYQYSFSTVNLTDGGSYGSCFGSVGRVRE